MTTILPDAAARAAITTDLEHNIVVEAAAGTGKTTCLVARICELVKKGALADTVRFAAVTFTIKAANELKERLQAELGRQAEHADTPDEERIRLKEGLTALAECHIGTIHSFCARLLRERPVEAGVNPDFRELDQNEDALYRLRAWSEFARRLASGQHQNLTNAFRTFGLDIDTLGEGFLRFADYPDVDRWIGGDARMKDIDLAAFNKGLADFTAGLGGFGAMLENAVPHTDQLIPILQLLNRRALRKAPSTTREAHQLAGLFKPNPKPVKKHWKGNFGSSSDEVDDHYNNYLRFFNETVKPFRGQCQSALYAAALAAFRNARDIYNRLRREDGVLNFQDLLMTTATVLRDFPDVRRELSDRFHRLLVDEVQDTDPIQAEILLLLASRDDRERDWRNSVPRSGSLFIVGDPKQSIYRFRRADIVVYQELKEMIVKNGGRLLELVANFRSQPVVLDWVNETFGPRDGDRPEPETVAASGRFSSDDSPYSPAYVPLAAGREQSADADLTGVFRLETLAAKKTPDSPVGAADILADEAGRIAGFIRDALDRGLTIPDRNGVRPVSPGDFMVVTYQKSAAPAYAAALGRLGIETEVSAGGALAGSPTLDMLRTYLSALANSDDPVAVLAVLRGPLYGVSDPELYRWKKSGHQFLFPYVPGAETPGAPETVRAALTLLRSHHRLFRHLDPVDCLEKIIGELGLWAYACLGDDPSTATGAVFTMLELLKAEQGGIAGPAGLLERFDWLRENFDGDVVPSLPAAGNAVRVMNVHKTKGLEAPVVFLTGTRNVRSRPADFSVNRDGGTVLGGMVLSGGEFANVVLACPEGWEELAGREELFLQAEKTRLNYVAATRAGSMLVVSVHPSSGNFKSAFLPGGNAAELLPEALAEPEIPPAAPEDDAAGNARIDAGELGASAERRYEGLAAALGQSYVLERAKPDHVETAVAASFAPRDPDFEEEGFGTDPELAADTGEILHRLLETNYDEERLTREAADMLREREHSVALAPDIARLVLDVRNSGIWMRAAAAEHCFREVPFTAVGEREGRTVVQRGVIDLVFREGDGWVVVDYKSDRIPPGVDPAEAAARHAGQLGAYRRAWEKATGETVSEALVFFVRSGKCVAVPDTGV